MSKRQQIIDALETRMKTILTTGGYQTNVGQRVSVWPTVPMAEASASELSIFDHDAEVMETGIIGQSRHELLVDIMVEIPGSDSRADVRKALADINKALWSGLTLGGLCEPITILSNGITFEQGAKVIGAGIVKIRVPYYTAHGEI